MDHLHAIDYNPRRWPPRARHAIAGAGVEVLTVAKKRKGNRNDISLGYRIDKVPGGRMSRGEVYTEIVKTVQTGKSLPRGLAVSLQWHNSKKGKAHEAPLATAVRKSRAGFLALILRRIARDASGVPGFRMPKLREATEREIEDIEEERDFYEDKAESAGHRKGGNTRIRETREKRSAAAKKGWATRRAAATKAAGAARKRLRK